VITKGVSALAKSCGVPPSFIEPLGGGYFIVKTDTQRYWLYIRTRFGLEEFGYYPTRDMAIKARNPEFRKRLEEDFEGYEYSVRKLSRLGVPDEDSRKILIETNPGPTMDFFLARRGPGSEDRIWI